MTLVCTLVYTRKVVNPTAAVLCSTLVVVTVGTVCLLGVQGSDYRNKVPAAEDVAQVTVQPMVEDPLVDLPDYMLEPGTHSVSTDTTESPRAGVQLYFYGSGVCGCHCAAASGLHYRSRD